MDSYFAFLRGIARASSIVQRVVTRFPLHSECVWPGRATDLYLAHLSIYCFAARYIAGGAILDAGCGAGYGARFLAEQGAREVLAVDLDPRFIAYARRRYRHKRVRYLEADLQTLELEARSVDVVVASNVLEHLERPLAFLERAVRALRPGGRMVLALPPIVDAVSLAQNRANPWHRTNLYVGEWDALLKQAGLSTTLFRQSFAGDARQLDFADPRRSRAKVDDFGFEEASLAAFGNGPSLGVVFLASPPP